MKILTETCSTYEIDVKTKHARRLSGVDSPTKRVGEDGVWKRYERLLVVPDWNEHASALLIDWTGKGNGTMTSRIERLIENKTGFDVVTERPSRTLLLDLFEAALYDVHANTIIAVLS